MGPYDVLCVTRKAGEVIVIPIYGITITVLRVGSDRRVLVGVDAPKDVKIWRAEIAPKVKSA